MKALKTLLATAALAASLAVAGGANAAVVITIGTSIGAGPITTKASGAVTPGQQVSSGAFSFGGYNITNITGTYDVLPDLLSGDSINLNSPGSATGTLNIFVTIQGLDASDLSPGALLSSFSSSKAPAGTVMSSYYDFANGLYSTANLLHSVTVSGASSSVWENAVGHPVAPFSLTEKFSVSRTGVFNGGADISAVPEPATWGLMILGFGGIGTLVRNRRRQAVFA